MISGAGNHTAGFMAYPAAAVTCYYHEDSWFGDAAIR